MAHLEHPAGTGAAPLAAMLLTLLLVVLLLLAIGSTPAWPYSRGWGYYPSGGLGLLVIVLVVVFMLSPGHVWW